MLLKDLLNLIWDGSHQTVKCDLWNADNSHKDIITNVFVEDIPKVFMFCEIEKECDNQRVVGLLAKEQNHFIISIHIR